MNPAFRNMNECWDAFPKTEQGVHLDCSLPVMELSPRTKFETEFYGTAIKA